MATTRVGVRTATRAALAVYAASLSLPALSLGLGDIEMQSFLNEPLRAQVELLDVRDLNPDDIRIRLARIEDFDRLGVDRSYFLTSIEFDVSVDPATGRGLIRLTTPDAVLEPYLDLIIEARWPQGRVLREYTVLVDPPAFREETITVSASQRVNDARPEKPAVAADSGAGAGPAAGSGDEVALRQSSLPPGAMPDRAFSAETAATPRAGSRYMVKRDETLWQIASVARPGDVTVQQAMLDIQRLNPEAFIDGNINRIKAGYIIYLPAAGEVSSDDLAAALAEVRAQNRAFAEGTTPGVSAAATLRVSADAEAVADAEAADERPLAAAPAAPSQPDIAQDTVDDGGAPGTAPAPTAPDEGPGDRVPAADGQLAAQLAAMSERLDTLEQIVAVKDEQIATLEQALREAREAAAAAPAAVVPTPAPAAPTRAPVTPPPAAGAAPSIPWLPIGGGAIAILLAIALFLRRRASRDAAVAEEPAASASDEDADVFRGVSLKSEALAETGDDAPPAAAPEPAPVASAADTDDLELDRGGSRGYGERKNDDYIDDGAAGDALAEADIYIAYGRYLQAIELLDTAIEAEPDNSAYRLKLTELYVDMGEEEKAAAQLEALREQGDADAIARAEALLGAVAPAAPASPEPEPEPEPEPAAPSVADDEAPASPAAGDEAHAAAAEELASAAPAGELDLDLDVGEPDLQLDLEAESEPPAAIESEDSPDHPAPEAAAIADAVDSVDTGEPLEFDQLEIEEDGAAGGDRDRLDLDDVDEPDEILDLTDALGEFSSARLDESADDDEEGEDLLIADDVDQMATKLDLARAYVDMGDSEGARGILEEVAAAASGDVQQEARELLERIS